MQSPTSEYKKHVGVIVLGLVAVIAVAGTFYYRYGSSFDNKIIVDNTSQKNGLAVVQSDSSSSTQEQGYLPTDDTASSNDTSNPSGPSGETTTDQVSQDFFARYIALEQSTTSPSSAEEQGVVDQVLQENDINLTYKTYTRADLNIDSSENSASEEAYGTALGEAIVSTSQAGLENELVILGNAIEANDGSALTQMETHVEIYQTLLTTFTAMKVPPSAVTLHLQLLNDISQLHAAAVAMNELFTDPLPALAGAGLYDTASDDLVATFGQYSNYFSSKGAVFAKGSTGYTFTHLTQ